MAKLPTPKKRKAPRPTTKKSKTTKVESATPEKVKPKKKKVSQAKGNAPAVAKNKEKSAKAKQKRNAEGSPRAMRKDPQAAREAERYENPVASREYLLQCLERAGVPMTLLDFIDWLKVKDPDQIEGLRRRLRAMERDGQLMCNRKGAYCAVDRTSLVRGTVMATRDGYGFLIPADGGEDLYLHGRQMRQLFHGDEVLARLGGEGFRGKAEAKIVEVLKHNTWSLVGRVREARGMCFVLAENPRIQHEVMVPPEDCAGARDGQYVNVEIVTQPGQGRPPTGRVTEVLGDHMAPGMEIEVALRMHGVPHTWPPETLREAEKFKSEPARSDKAGRFDLRDQPFVTIDGEDAKDFDDAVYCEKRRGGGWILWVAIADVSHYVRPDSALDKEAVARGNSVYFPGQVVPMLPEQLSNGLCSLKPEVDRLAMVCEMRLDRDGELKDYVFYDAVIRSHARLTYTAVAATLNGEDAGIEKRLVKHLRHLYELYGTLRAARESRGAIDFETTETRIVFGADRKIEEVIPIERNDAHKLIEECMLCANVATAEFLEKHKLDALYRVHEGPGEEKLVQVRGFLRELGLSLRGGDTPQPGDYQLLLQEVEDRPDRHVIQTVMLRSLKQARYQPENLGHFGLNYPAYAHFTSPIRRYPDLLVHRAIRAVIHSNRRSKHVRRHEQSKPVPFEMSYPYSAARVVELGMQCSMTERRADDAVRDVMAWLKCEYLNDRIGEEFDGVINAVTAFGIFVEMKDVYVDGLVHISELDNDYYYFDAPGHRLIGERTRRVFRLGDKVRVQVSRVNLDDRKIDLMLVAQQGRPKAPGLNVGRDSRRPTRNRSSGNKGPRTNKSRTRS